MRCGLPDVGTVSLFVDTILLIASDIKIDCLLKLAPHMLYACN